MLRLQKKINKELLKLAGEELNKRIRKRLYIFPAALCSTIKQVFSKFNIPNINLRTMMTFSATVTIPKNNT